ncbi:chromate transporter [Siccirubricoccus deserti]|uniref:Chromate efflux transporter n=1 Tax=Siccirubricoccus deserti TaxID=2013562 RepID=A0A9X0UFB4_9PROT|nr:chromate efflux transporter [Siccirubricoccus deserti]MBC4018774.1 chromate efflux transporter [Siccirubricoccus deserti]GGC68374.1 chromate transporter [Siccirubricoccus deserti]
MSVKTTSEAVAATDAPEAALPRLPSFGEALRVWLKIGLLSFGGPAGQIALLHREVVDDRRWVSDARFLHALNFCTLLPGPEAQQLATYLGWLLHGVKGGIAAGVLFVLPGVAVMLGLSILYATLGEVPVVAALFFGLKAAVLVLVVEALLRVARRALKTNEAWALAGAAFLALYAFSVPFPLVVLAAALIGYLAPGHFRAGGHGSAKDGPPAALDAVLAADPGRPARLAAKAWRAGWVAVALWLVPVAALMTLVGGVFADVAWFFSKMAVVTVGGAYAVLAYVAQEAVEGYGWLTPGQMLVGLGLAETTPGPLILVLQFVGFLAGYGAGGLVWGVLASVLTVWVTFAPCFAFIFLGAPYVERLHANRTLTGALAAVTAAVVGVIANLALWFGLRVLFADVRRVEIGPATLDMPALGSLDPLALALAALAAACLFGFKIGLLRTLGVTAAAGLVLRMAGL